MSAPGDEPPTAEATSPVSARRPRSDQERIDRARMRSVAVVVTGAVVGAALAVARTHLGGIFGPLADSAGAWLAAPCVLGALMRTRRGAVGAGLACALVQLGAWAATTAARDLPMPAQLVAFWFACTLAGGPLAGLAGDLLRRPVPGSDGAGAAMAVALFVAEGVWNDFHELRADAPGWLWVAIAALIAVVGLRSARRLRWLALTLPLAFAGEIALTGIYR